MPRFPSMLLAFALVSAIAGSVSAQTVKFGPQGESIQATPVATVVAEPGETDQEFLLRRGKLFRGYTASTGFEVCAQVCRSADGRLGMSVYTSGSHIGCATIDQCPVGMSSIGESMHSHPQYLTFVVNDADRAFLRARQPGAHIQRSQRESADRHPGFSEIDFAGGPGYLVTGDTLLHQSGENHVTIVGTIPPAD